MRLMIHALLAIGLLTMAGCGANGTAQGGGTDNAGYGHVKIGVPF
jgi:hypothetical protein